MVHNEVIHGRLRIARDSITLWRMSELLTIEQLSCERGGKTLFRDRHYHFMAGQIYQILGANGAGKSTLLRLLAGFALPYRGNIVRHSTDLAYLGHASGLQADLTVAENLRYLLTLRGVDSDIAIMQIDEDFLDWPQLHNKVVRDLSAGQQRRLALSAVFLSAKTIWLLDEPMTALDKMSQDYLCARFAAHREQGGCVIVATHQALMLPQVQSVSLEGAAALAFD